MNATKFRPHRGSLADALAECVEVTSPEELKAAILKEESHSKVIGIRIKDYGFDKRIDWDTYIVTVQHERNGKSEYGGVAGFTNGAADEVCFGSVDH